MSHLRKLGSDQAGFDASRNLQILPLGRRTSFHLIAGDGLSVWLEQGGEYAALQAGDNDDQAAHRRTDELSGWERQQVIRRINLRGLAPGEARLRAQLNGADWIQPLTVRVTDNPDARQVGPTNGQVTPQLRQELQALPLRQAVIRVAEDQMHSAIAGTDGFSRYMASADNWCGAFAYFCWRQACAAKGVPCPFPTQDTLLSPQKAIHWGMHNPSLAEVIRYQGTSPLHDDGRTRQAWVELRDQLEPADIVLIWGRSHDPNNTRLNWRHVCMVHSRNGAALETIDGNQGAGQSIRLRSRNTEDRAADNRHTLSYVHVRV